MEDVHTKIAQIKSKRCDLYPDPKIEVFVNIDFWTDLKALSDPRFNYSGYEVVRRAMIYGYPIYLTLPTGSEDSAVPPDYRVHCAN